MWARETEAREYRPSTYLSNPNGTICIDMVGMGWAGSGLNNGVNFTSPIERALAQATIDGDDGALLALADILYDRGECGLSLFLKEVLAEG